MSISLPDATHPDNTAVEVYYSTLAPTALLRRVVYAEECSAARYYHRDADRQRFLTARLLCRQAAASQLACTPEQLSIEKTTEGAPFLVWRHRADNTPLPAISITHSGDWIAIALCRQYAVGIDLEYERACHFAGFDDIALHHAESRDPQQYSRAAWWTAKEAATKVWGIGLQRPPQHIHLCPQHNTFTAQTVNLPVVNGCWLSPKLSTDTGTTPLPFSLAVATNGMPNSISMHQWYWPSSK